MPDLYLLKKLSYQNSPVLIGNPPFGSISAAHDDIAINYTFILKYLFDIIILFSKKQIIRIIQKNIPEVLHGNYF